MGQTQVHHGEGDRRDGGSNSDSDSDSDSSGDSGISAAYEAMMRGQVEGTATVETIALTTLDADDDSEVSAVAPSGIRHVYRFLWGGGGRGRSW